MGSSFANSSQFVCRFFKFIRDTCTVGIYISPNQAPHGSPSGFRMPTRQRLVTGDSPFTNSRRTHSAGNLLRKKAGYCGAQQGKFEEIVSRMQRSCCESNTVSPPRSVAWVFDKRCLSRRKFASSGRLLTSRYRNDVGLVHKLC